MLTSWNSRRDHVSTRWWLTTHPRTAYSTIVFAVASDTSISSSLGRWYCPVLSLSFFDDNVLTGCHDTQHNVIQFNETQHYGTQHNDIIMTLSITMLNAYAECQIADCLLCWMTQLTLLRWLSSCWMSWRRWLYTIISTCMRSIAQWTVAYRPIDVISSPSTKIPLGWLPLYWNDIRNKKHLD